MPFITIELPSAMQFELAPFAKRAHAYLSETFDIPLEKLKTKLVRCDAIFMGDGSGTQSYARLKVELKGGRDREKLKKASLHLLEQFKKAIREQNSDTACRITAEFHEINPELLQA